VQAGTVKKGCFFDAESSI